MNRYQKEPFEELSDEQLEELLAQMDQEMSNKSKEKIKQTVSENINKETEKIKPLKSKKKKWATILGAAAVLSLMVGYTQVDTIKAAYVKAFGTEAEKVLTNSEKLDYSVEDQGLKLTAKNTFRDGNTTYVLMELQDLTGDRLSEDTSISDWSMLNGGNTQVINYDKKTKTAMLLVSSVSWEEHKDTGFILKQFESHIKEMRNTVSVDWKKDLATNVKWKKYDGKNGVGGGSVDDSILEKLNVNYEELYSEYLPNKRLSIPLIPDEDYFIENMAYKDGLLHILVKWPNIKGYNFLNLDFQPKDASKEMPEKNGNEVWPYIASYSAYNTETHSDETGRSDYEEFVFDIKESELQNYDLTVEAAKTQTVVSGNWAIKLKEPKEIEKKALKDITLKKENLALSNINLSGLSLSFDVKDSSREQMEKLTLDVKLVKKDGEIIDLTKDGGGNIYTENGESQVSLMYDYTELSDIDSVIINGQTLKVE
ncbi:DUF4179 domain-containing protein [Vagococcus bubulae]|uniref:Uncharacterized protein n=1 Tax=Vagococcus bubulae TaxID=1977868 RepID=A0A429ZQD5_9ENTE|nr:DUF4179 domain-containing protein [Vagococcus bubulae]RST95896.1 hypothetical protein CBF36_01640 [Vagococcus bubulae]